MNKARKESLQQRQLCGFSEEIDGKSYQKWGKFPTTQRKNGKSLKNRLCFHLNNPKKNSKVTFKKLWCFIYCKKSLGGRIHDYVISRKLKQRTLRKNSKKMNWTDWTWKNWCVFQSGFRFHVVFLVGVFFQNLAQVEIWIVRKINPQTTASGPGFSVLKGCFQMTSLTSLSDSLVSF